jgi:1,2-diacylglycerol-3-alpha-glucose alpha-1,2-galactosyltransferase
MKKEKLSITMFSSADSVQGQGVGSAYTEQVELIKSGASDLFDVSVNKWNSKPDIQHFHTVDPIFFTKIKSKNALNVAYCHFLPDTLEGSLRIPKAFMPFVSSYVTGFYKSADKLVVVNPSFINQLVKYGIDRSKIEYIPNFVSKEKFHPLAEPDRKRWREKFGLKQDAFTVLGCGQVQTRKGVWDFVHTAELLPDIQFVWAGGFSFGPMTDGYEELKELMKNPPANVSFIGMVSRDDMVHIYNMVDTLFIPSYNELFPMTILESVNLSKPLVIRDLELYEDILFDHYLKGHTNEDFAAHIRALADEPQMYEKWSQESDKLAEFYSRDNVLKLWRDFYVRSWKEKFEKPQEPNYANIR